ncbi:MAG: GLPGLI family protein [Bergeyella sp.]
MIANKNEAQAKPNKTNMKFFTTLLLLSAIFVTAQNKRFIYEYKFISDSTNREDLKTEMMNLDVLKEGSKFYSYTVYHSDSIMKADLEQQLKATGAINIKADSRKGNIRYTVTKSYPDYKINLLTRISMDSYSVAEDRKISWKILSEKEKIGEWEAQKAETEFAGRKWTAWFTTEIPVQDGPYKFHGLPGLIVKLEDKTASHIFELKGIRNIAPEGFDNDVFSMGNRIAVNRKQYNKLLNDYENDPTKSMKQLRMTRDIVVVNDEGSAKDKEQEKLMKERIRKNNNIIELD